MGGDQGGAGGVEEGGLLLLEQGQLLATLRAGDYGIMRGCQH